jgi:DMSO/TMAO reductase YedYZ molybdopterin-dependent catalytic subunit
MYSAFAMTKPLLTIDGDVESPTSLSFADLAAFPAEHQILDVSRIDAKRQGDAVTLAGLVAHVKPKASARYLTLHASADDFHASIPLDAVRQRAFLIYRVNGEPLSQTAGGPFRFYIPDFAACHTSEIDECANVKFVDRMQFSASPGQDNRPHDAQEHAELHEREAE